MEGTKICDILPSTKKLNKMAIILKTLMKRGKGFINMPYSYDTLIGITGVSNISNDIHSASMNYMGSDVSPKKHQSWFEDRTSGYLQKDVNSKEMWRHVLRRS